MTNPKNINEYISSFPKEIQKILKQLHVTIKKTAPLAEELISYGMPAYKLNGMLVWFAAHSKHIGFYPKTSAIEIFKKELSSYKCSKGTIQFPYDKPLPLPLINKILKFRITENLKKVKSKKK
jgi:uncharacterized protein YdhG (YjbR/CyaY superfamily)